MDYQIVTWPITLRDPRRCCEAVRSAILATAWLLVFCLYFYLFILLPFIWWIKLRNIDQL